MKYSGGQITKAGETLIRLGQVADNELDHALDVVSSWRFCHEYPLNQALALVKEIVSRVDKDAIFAKRLKRSVSIYKKLKRFEGMTLRNMQDIGGCRAIVATEKKLWQCVRELRRRVEFRTASGSFRVKDYIKSPKEDGYRSYHLVGRFKGGDGDNRMRNIEIQIRTRVQHYWATALEIVDLFTDQALKSNRGEREWKIFFKEAGTQFAIIDSIHMFNSLPSAERRKRFLKIVNSAMHLRDSLQQFQKISGRLGVVNLLDGFSNSIQIVNQQIDDVKRRGYVLLKIRTVEKMVDTVYFAESDGEVAREHYLNAEKEATRLDDVVVALVSSAAVGGIKEAYPNYFADSGEFLKRVMFLQQVS